MAVGGLAAAGTDMDVVLVWIFSNLLFFPLAIAAEFSADGRYRHDDR